MLKHNKMDIPELFNIIFNHLTIRDKRSLLLTCKKYYKKSLLSNIKYAVYTTLPEKDGILLYSDLSFSWCM